MSAKNVQGPGGKKPASAATNLIGRQLPCMLKALITDMRYAAGGGAGMMEALVCHPLGEPLKDICRPALTQVRYYQGAHAAF